MTTNKNDSQHKDSWPHSKTRPANPALSAADKTYLRGLRRRGYTQEEIKTIASDAGFTVPGDLFETGKRQKQA